MVLVALFAALTAVFSQISIPIGPVPINLGLLAVFVAGGLLGLQRAMLSQVVMSCWARRAFRFLWALRAVLRPWQGLPEGI